MIPSNAPAVLAKARAMYGKRITPQQFEELLHCKSVREVTAFLKTQTHYGPSLAAVSEADIHRGQLEELLRRAFFENSDKLYYYQNDLSGTQFQFFLQEAEIRQLLRMVFLLRAGEPEHFIVELPPHLMQRGKLDFLAISQVKSFDQLILLLQSQHTVYGDILAKFRPENDRKLDLLAMEHALWLDYFSRMLQTLTSTDHETEELEELVKLRVELLNLRSLYRNVLYLHLPLQHLEQEVLLPWGTKLRREAILALAEAKNEEEFWKILLKNPFYARFSPTGEESIEHFTDRLFASRCRHLLYFTTNSDLCFYTYLLLAQQEEQNVVTLLEGIRYGMNEDQIRKLLIL